ncbi:MAG: hypothetical protein ACT4OE_01590 [Sphingosinicella sp.]
MAAQGRKQDRHTKSGKDKINRPRSEKGAFAIAGNVRLKGEDPSPDDRARGETSSKEPASAVDRR